MLIEAPAIAKAQTNIETLKGLLATQEQGLEAENTKHARIKERLHSKEIERAEREVALSAYERQQDDAIREAQTKKAEIKRTLENIIKEQEQLTEDSLLKTINIEMEFTSSRAAVLETRDTDCQSTTCGFILDALKAKDSIKGLKEKREARMVEIQDRTFILQEEMKSLGQKGDEIRQKISRIENVRGMQSRNHIHQEGPGSDHAKYQQHTEHNRGQEGRNRVANSIRGKVGRP